MAHRSDDGNLPVKIVRDIPMWGVLGVLGAVAIQAILLWASVQEQTKQLSALTAEVKDLRGAVISSNLKGVEHDVKISDHERRITALEQRSKP